MSARLVKWNRTSSGSTFSKCGRFAIKPGVGLKGRPVFVLRKLGTVTTPGSKPRAFSEDYGGFPTITKAKAYVEKIAKAEEARRVIAFAEELEREKREREG